MQEAAESPAPTRRARLASLASVSGMPLAGLMVFAFMMGARKFILFDVVNMELLGCALGAVVALPICLLRTSRPLTTLIYRMLVPAFALVLIVLNSFPGTTMPMFFAAWLTYVFYGAVAILALASLAAVAHAREFSAGSVFGTAVAAFALFSLLGLGCAPTAPFQEEGGGPALLVVSTFYFVGVIAAALWGFWRAGAGADAQAQSVQALCEALADEAGLTPREREILGYLGRGHGIAFVAATLVISESTVRTHVKSIYKKLGVNGREELLAKVDEG